MIHNDSNTSQYFDTLNEHLSNKDLTPQKFIQLTNHFQIDTQAQQIVKFFETFEVPKFYNPNSWVLEECFKMLIQQDTNLKVNDFDGCDMDIKDNFDETLLNYAVRKFKNRSLQLMLKKGANQEMANEKGITPIGQAIISRNC